MRELQIYAEGLTLSVKEDQIKGMWVGKELDEYVEIDLFILQNALATEDLVQLQLVMDVEEDENVKQYLVNYTIKQSRLVHTMMVEPYE